MRHFIRKRREATQSRSRLRAVLVAGVLWVHACATSPPPPEEPPPTTQSCPQLTLSFVVDHGYDARTIYSILHGEDPAGLESRAASMGLDVELAETIHGATSYGVVRDTITEVVDARYEEIGRNMARARGAYESAWTPFTEVFSDRIIQATGGCWVHPSYTVVVSAFHPGLSSWDQNIVASKFDYDLPTKRRIVAHEIVLSQVFQTVRARRSPEELGDWEVWAFSEITAAILLGDEALRTYWPQFPTEGYFAHSNYPQLSLLEAELRRIFDESSSFEGYLSDALPVLENLKREQLMRDAPP